MKNDENKLFTIGEFASKSGVTLRTLRYYDKIGLLKPSSYNNIGHRLYSQTDFARLQKILTLKFIGLSLEEINNIIKYDVNDFDFKNSLEIQKKIMEEKIKHISMVINAINETLHMVNHDNVLNWDKFVNIINIINLDNKWLEQYQNASNLRSRIKIHEFYSSNKYGWMNWFFDKLVKLKCNKILELGCGDGSLWRKNSHRIPPNWDITLTDFSVGMLNDAQNNVENINHSFKFEIVDAQSIPYPDNSFDVVIANHMLYHLSDINKALKEINRVLKPGGIIFTSTVGKNHMVEMREIITNFYPGIKNLANWEHTESFQLENGSDKLKEYFNNIELERYKDSLFVTNANAIIDYIFSMPDNIKEHFAKDTLKSLTSYLQDIISKHGGIYITKDTGYFKGIKN